MIEEHHKRLTTLSFGTPQGAGERPGGQPVAGRTDKQASRPRRHTQAPPDHCSDG
ncbi:hypothetical protein GCM10011505_51190 [Tistrella bauzanensis]|uniref:Uncharacterized protein n=1 Tax=Tistrella bauzanensis TaxID=657419 RepID=A0ABQ1JBL5_9PROT|nr:hypothetical protein GCM10011505_51190 [Tistrella bauzanensis]